VISYLDGPGKSGNRLAQLYADENRVHSRMVVERGRLSALIERNGADLSSIVFVDDIFGTGRSVDTYLRTLDEEVGDALVKHAIPCSLVALCGFDTAAQHIEQVTMDLKMTIRVNVCDLLTEADRCFGEQSRVFVDADERERARTLMKDLGRGLVRDNPLGFGDCQALVAFETGCPNNSLPVLWAESKKWKPLFMRL